ncbi:MAG: toll/interleukin-1 receptor domain-containing protein [Phycisphaerales bacterium]|nr:toll/interleukin-1 receptor domain-containing protein [Phycisphaerales bacterium]
MTWTDQKLAWPRTDEFTARAVTSVAQGNSTPFEDIVRAAGGKLTVFNSQAAKSSFAIYQHSLCLRDALGRVAVFHRHKGVDGHIRISPGRSILVSTSSLQEPWKAVPNLAERKLSWGRKSVLSGFEPLGVATNDLPATGKGPQPFYMMAVYQHTIGENRLNGMIRDYPDTFIGWCHAADIAERGYLDGFVDRLVAKTLAVPSLMYTKSGDGRSQFSRQSMVTDSRGSVPPCQDIQVAPSRAAFISHAGEDWFVSQMLAVVLSHEEGGEVFPIVDTADVRFGEEHWPQIEQHIDGSDCVLVLVTAHTAGSSGVKREVEYARSVGVPIIPVLVDALPPTYLDELWAKDLRQYRHMQSEMRDIINRIVSQPSRA